MKPYPILITPINKCVAVRAGSIEEALDVAVQISESVELAGALNLRRDLRPEDVKLGSWSMPMELSMHDVDDYVRRCSHCGRPMKEGYYLAGEYACSDECCLVLYEGNKAQMEEDLSHAEEDDSEVYYTEWESIFSE